MSDIETIRKKLNLEEYADIMTLKEFDSCVDSGAFIDYDGFGFPILDNGEAILDDWDDNAIKPSDYKTWIPENTTHVVWYNR